MSVEASQPISFRPESLAALITTGHEAYRVLFEALSDPAFSAALDASETASSEKGQGLTATVVADALRRLPSPEVALGLWELALLQHSARTGQLEYFYSEPTRDDGQPASLALRQWGAAYDADLSRLFPEVMRERPLQDANPPKVSSVAQFVVDRAADFANRTTPSLGSTPAHGLFVLLRDQARELAPLLSRLQLDIDELVRSALNDATVSELSEEGWAETLSERELDIADALGRTPDARYVFLAIIQLFDSPTIDRIRSHVGQIERVVEAIDATATATALPQDPRSLNIQARAVSDLPADEDVIGVSPLVDGLEALLSDPKTTLPLAIGINAPWGAGKSSVMLQLRRRLEGSTARRWRSIEFDAWKYEQSERLWAALAKAVYEQPVAEMGRWERVKFRTRLEIERLGWWAFLSRTVLPIVAAAALVIVVAATGAKAATSVSIATIAGALGLGQAARMLGLVADPFKRAIDRYAEQGAKYADKLGFTAEADEDIGQLTRLLTRRDGQALAIFVDDLDRCSPKHVVEVVEAINQIFNSAAGRPCLFILGMDRDVVAASSEAAYAELIAAMDPKLAEDFGVRFLAKLVQLFVSVPPPSMSGMERLLEKVTGNPPPRDEVDDAAADGLIDEQVAVARQAIEAAQPANPADVARAASTAPADIAPAALDQAVRQARAVRFNADSEDVANAEYELLAHLPRNPRDVKRFDNAFRLQLHVANGTPGCRLTFSRDELLALGKWVTLRMRWPEVARQFDADVSLIAKVETEANDGAAATGFEWPAEREALRDLLRESDPARRPAQLPFPTFLRAL